MDLALAQHELDYYNKRTGFTGNPSNDNKADETGNSETPEAKPAEEPVKTDVKVTEWKGIKSIKTDKEKADLENEIKSNPNFNQDPKLQDALNHIQSIVTDETKERNKKERAAKIKATINEWENNPDPNKAIPEGFEPDWVDGKPTIRPIKDTKK